MPVVPYPPVRKPDLGFPIGWQVSWLNLLNGDTDQPLEPAGVCRSSGLLTPAASLGFSCKLGGARLDPPRRHIGACCRH
jgi:hypothetical protein